MKKDFKEGMSKFLEEIEVDESFWNAWISSDACSLNTEDIIILKGFILTGNHQYSCTELHISIARAEQSFESSKGKIVWSYRVYRSWLTDMFLDEFHRFREGKNDCLLLA
jgi:hypothetical protein